MPFNFVNGYFSQQSDLGRTHANTVHGSISLSKWQQDVEYVISIENIQSIQSTQNYYSAKYYKHFMYNNADQLHTLKIVFIDQFNVVKVMEVNATILYNKNNIVFMVATCFKPKWPSSGKTIRNLEKTTVAKTFIFLIKGKRPLPYKFLLLQFYAVVLKTHLR
jgi:hypothetical protein